MQSLFGPRNKGVFAQAGFQAFQQALPALRVAHAGLAQGCSKVPHFNKLGQGRLQGHLAGTVQVVMRLVKWRDQRLGNHQIAQLQARVQHFRKGAHVQNPLVLVQPFQ